jgi:SurA N-terminal domain
MSPMARMAACVVAGAVLGACGGSFQPPAAVVNGVVIRDATVAQVVREALTDPATAQQVASGGVAARQDLTRRALARLIELSLARAYAAQRGIRVTYAEVSSALRQVEQSFGGPAAFDRLLRARALSLAEVRGTLEDNVLLGKVQDSLARQGRNVGPESPTAIFNEWLKERAQSSDIRINPRFGAFDPARGLVVPLDSTALLPG